jgi:hypothetical protein
VNLQDTLVVLDTCVLMPPRLSDVLMDMRAARLFSAHWTKEIDDEYLRNMQGAFQFTEAAARRRLSAMKAYCPEWEVAPTADATQRVPEKVDAKDRHVAAAALTLRQYADEDSEDEESADSYDVYLVTSNTRHFAKKNMAALGVAVVKPGEFLDAVHAAAPSEAEQAVLKAVKDLGNPPYIREQMLAALQGHGSKTMVQELAKKWTVKPGKRATKPKGT